MMLDFTQRHTIPAAYSLLPSAMESDAATAMLLAIGLQESRFKHRQQIGGPAQGWWQFERGGGVIGVLSHDATKQHASEVCEILGYKPNSWVVYGVLADNDVLAACFARLLLWTLPAPLPTDADEAWRQYLEAWRPGKPHPATWPRNYAAACEAVYPDYSSGE